MPIRVSNTVERSIRCVPTAPVVVAATTPKEILTNVETPSSVEYAGRYIQNVGADDCYYAFGRMCDPTNFDGIMSKGPTLNANGHAAGQQLDISNCPQSVWVYSVAGTIIAITLLKRNDLTQGNTGILSVS